MSTAPVRQMMTVEEYLALEDVSEEKHEYCGGEVFAIAGAGFQHNQITSNVQGQLWQLLKDTPCRIYGSDLKIHVETTSLFTYPDLSVICHGPQFWKDRKDIITNPAVIIEVLSPDTMNYDRGEKFSLYRKIPSLKEYILISSMEIHLEKFVKKTENEWTLTEFESMDSLITIDTIQYQTVLKEFYSDVAFEKPIAKGYRIKRQM